MVDLSIIIVSYNTKDLTRKCLGSIYENVKGVSFEVICIDNDSRDGSQEMIKKEYPQVKLIESKKNLGYAKGNNLGIEESKGKYVLLLNSDTIILPNSLKRVFDFMEEHSDAGAASPKLLNPDGSIQYCVRTLPDIKTATLQTLGWHKLFPKNKVTAKYYRTDLDYNKILSVDSIGTTCYMIRREVLQKIGLLDEDFFMYNVDLDFNKRIKDAGYNIYYMPDAKIIHYGGVSVNKSSYKGLIEQHQGMWLLYKKHYAAKRNPILNLLIYKAIYLRLGIKLILAFFSKDKRVVKGPGAPREKIDNG